MNRLLAAQMYRLGLICSDLWAAGWNAAQDNDPARERRYLDAAREVEQVAAKLSDARDDGAETLALQALHELAVRCDERLGYDQLLDVWAALALGPAGS